MSLTENASSKRLEESGWNFSQLNNFLSAEGKPAAKVEGLQPAEIEGLEVWKAWLRDWKAWPRESIYEPITEQYEVSGATQQIQLAEPDTEIVLQALLNPPEPTADLVAAFRRHENQLG